MTQATINSSNNLLQRYYIAHVQIMHYFMFFFFDAQNFLSMSSKELKAFLVNWVGDPVSFDWDRIRIRIRPLKNAWSDLALAKLFRFQKNQKLIVMTKMFQVFFKLENFNKKCSTKIKILQIFKNLKKCHARIRSIVTDQNPTKRKLPIGSNTACTRKYLRYAIFHWRYAFLKTDHFGNPSPCS
jgi:hypothetical protein